MKTLTFAITFLVILIDGKQMFCESDHLVCDEYKSTCFIQNSAEIDSQDFTVSSRRNDVKYLTFQGNKQIFYLPTKLYETFPDLTFYEADRCSIKSVSKENFKNLGKLEQLYLRWNKIKRVDSNTFENLFSLDTLELSFNPIKVMSVNAFKKIRGLRILDLNGTCFNASLIDYEGYLTMVNHVERFEKNCGGSPCGKIQLLTSPSRVKGGRHTELGQWPFLVALEKREANKFFCGGNLISTQHVLTAAHCVQDKWSSKIQPHEIIARLGSFDLRDRNEPGSAERDVTRVEINPGWNIHSERWEADIAILFMNDHVQFSDIIQPVCLPTDSSIEDVSAGFVAGWGRSDNVNDSFIEHTPEEVSLSIVSDGDCYREFYLIAKIATNNTFCAGGDNAGPCDGDSGGGFFVTVDGRWILKGLVSASMVDANGCDVNKYALYTNVIKFIPWIESFVDF